MNLRPFCLWIPVLFIGIIVRPVLAQTSSRPPNVLFIISDDLRPDLGCYGNQAVKTPNIDRLAREGSLFERAYCQVAVCNPSRSSLLTGLRPDTTGIFDQTKYVRPQMPDVVTLPQLFKNHGYVCLSMGKVFHQSEKQPGNDPLSWSEPIYGFGTPYRQWFTKESADIVKEAAEGQPDKPSKRGPPYEASDHPDDDYPDGKTAQKAIETLQRVKDQPFFVAVGFVKPHLAFCCPQKYWDMYPADSVALPGNYHPPKDVPAAALHTNYELRTYGGVPPEGDVSLETALNLIRGYRACTSFMDAQVGRVLDELDRLGLRETTIVVFLGDNGFHLGENGLWTKMTNFERGTHVPLIISAPHSKTAGGKIPALVEFVDVYPTVAQLAGLPLPANLEGTSLVPLLNNPNLPWKSAAFSQYGRGRSSTYRPEKDPMGRSIRTDRYRYTEWRAPGGTLIGSELYDEKNDPEENVNIASLPENKDLTAQLAEKLKAGWRAALPPATNIP